MTESVLAVLAVLAVFALVALGTHSLYAAQKRRDANLAEGRPGAQERTHGRGLALCCLGLLALCSSLYVYAPHEEPAEDTANIPTANMPIETKTPAPKKIPPIKLQGLDRQSPKLRPVSKKLKLQSGLCVLAVHTRSGYLSFKVLNPRGKAVINGLVAGVGGDSEMGLGGDTKCSWAMRIEDSGTHVLKIDPLGPWSIKIMQPRQSSAPDTREFSGKGTQATGLFHLLPGRYTLAANHTGSSDSLTVTVLAGDGEWVDAPIVSGNPKGSSPLSVEEEGIYILSVEADGSWSIRIT